MANYPDHGEVNETCDLCKKDQHDCTCSEITITCVECVKQYTVLVPTEGMKKWMDGEKIQVAMPNVSPNVRELLMTKICPKCFDKLFDEE